VLSVSTALIALFILAAGTLKLSSMDAFARAVRTWDLLPISVMDAVTIVVPPIEVTLGLGWLLGVHRRACTAGMLSLLLGFTITYTAHLIFSTPPDCGCLGELRFFEQRQSEAVFLIARNVLLAAVLLPGVLGRR
jgi:uncharacterized membrane protein YphA (DoxX/SURF4 family)